MNSLDDFDAGVRKNELEELLVNNADFPEDSENVNMHFHSFFSYNAQGWSPTHIAFEARQAGLHAAGLCDFDVLDGLEEFLEAGCRLGLRSAVNLETRVFLTPFADKEITSPGEPGVTYIMGAGFPRVPAAGTEAAAGLEGYRRRARERNLALVERINAALPSVAIDYETDVLPLTPAGAATERHIIRAYIRQGERALVSPDIACSIWAQTCGVTEARIREISGSPSMDDLVRTALAKRGGVGYVQPSEETFPPAAEFLAWARSCDAIPMITWLDGTSEGEADPHALFECQMAMGAAGLNIIPDRNWNLNDPETKQVKQENLQAAVAAAQDLALPINIGTEMNKAGQPFADNLKGAALASYAGTFRRGADIMTGHTLLARYADYPYCGEQAAADFKTLTARNDFFAAVGGRPPLSVSAVREFEAMTKTQVLDALRDQLK